GVRRAGAGALQAAHGRGLHRRVADRPRALPGVAAAARARRRPRRHRRVRDEGRRSRRLEARQRQGRGRPGRLECRTDDGRGRDHLRQHRLLRPPTLVEEGGMTVQQPLLPIDVLGSWIGIFLTFCILSYLYKDNPFYKLAEHLFVGVSVGYAITQAWYNV